MLVLFPPFEFAHEYIIPPDISFNVAGVGWGRWGEGNLGIFWYGCASRGGGGEGGGRRVTGIILVRVCEPVFRNLPHLYT